MESGRGAKISIEINDASELGIVDEEASLILKDREIRSDFLESDVPFISMIPIWKRDGGFIRKERDLNPIFTLAFRQLAAVLQNGKPPALG